MLTGIIGVEKTPSPPSLSISSKAPSARDNDSDESEPEKLKSKLIQSMKKNRKEKIPETNVSRDKLVDPEKKVNYVFYDPEMHWCVMCNVFPKTAKDYLNHLHSKEHMAIAKNQDSPWHDMQQADEFPSYPNAPTKRTPIRGLQFFSASTAWYCKLCAIWMGDLHCASTHLKSKMHSDNYTAYAEQNPHFDMDWMADRQKAYNAYREKVTSGKASPLMHVIALQPDDDAERMGKKKKKSDGKKDKKKKSRKKRRRQSTSSSSSSTSSDTETDSKLSLMDASLDGVTANSIRVSMRNMNKPAMAIPDDDNAVGKWTMVQPAQISSQTPFAPPAPSISTEAKKRDELIISQWTPGPVISDSERKLLDDLKGKLKKRSETEVNDERRRSKSPDRRTRRRSRSRGRYSRSRSRSRSPYYRGYNRGRRSGSRGRRVIEKPVVNYPPEPKRSVEKKSKGKSEGNGERKKSPPKKKPVTKGKLPFIGRMPVFKKQVAAEDAAKLKEIEAEDAAALSVPETKKTPAQANLGMSQSGSTMDDELMPDPTQFMALIGAAPMPPMRQQMEKSEEVLPPGIDEAEADQVPKPISDAPRPRKGPLPKDFQDALDLIFPDENKKVAPKPAADANREIVDMDSVAVESSVPEVTAEEANQPAIGMYGAYATAFPGTSAYAVYEGLSGAIQQEGIEPPPPPIDMDTGDSPDNSIPHVEMTIDESKTSSTNNIELDDLALLGIDADDMAAQCM
ncbi:zinc finger matrin-type protein CG9776 isoform X2 [Phlebotomus argentipes]|nr:zinc finger matrin-type protein CG9776 isoform X2 [Phlebotomus argentipes]